MWRLWLQISPVAGVREWSSELCNWRNLGGMPFAWLPPFSYLGAAALRLDPRSDLRRRKSSSRAAHDQMEPPPCKEHSSSAPPCILRTGLCISVLLGKAPKRLSSVCSLEAAWQGGMGRGATGTFEYTAAGSTRGP